MTDTPPNTTVAERINVGLIAQASEKLAETTQRTKMSKTDVVNRAITVYAFVEEQIAAGKELVFRDPATGTEQTVKLI